MLYGDSKRLENLGGFQHTAASHSHEVPINDELLLCPTLLSHPPGPMKQPACGGGNTALTELPPGTTRVTCTFFLFFVFPLAGASEQARVDARGVGKRVLPQ